MKYISSNLLRTATSTSSKLPFSGLVRPHRSEAVSVDIDDDFAEAIDCRLISPVLIPIQDSGTTNPLLIVRLGFKIKLPVATALLWVRFQAKVSGHAGPNNHLKTIEIVSFIPLRVSQDMVLGGRIIKHDDGTLGREQVALEDAGSSAMSFKPFCLGYKIHPSHIIWDFLPEDGSPPTSTDKLVLEVNAGEHTELHLSQSLQVCVTNPKYGRVNFEFPTETELVKTVRD